MGIVKNPLEDTLLYEKTLPVKWCAFGLLSSEQSLTEINRDNEILLHVLLGQEESIRETDDTRHESSLELQRLDAKLNLLLSWMGQWLVSSQGVPESHPIRLSEQGIGLDLPITINVGETLLLEVYLNTQFPQPIRLPCVVYAVNDTTTGREIIANFTGLTTEVHDLIEKFIFRHHRRLVALRRKQDQS